MLEVSSEGLKARAFLIVTIPVKYFGNYGCGGIFGLIDGRGATVAVQNCYNTNKISGAECIGGIGGGTWYIESCLITGCYNIGEIAKEAYYGGIVGWPEDTTILNCYSLDESAEYLVCPDTEITITESEIKEEADMKTQEFVDLLNTENEEEVWHMDNENKNNGYPVLK